VGKEETDYSLISPLDHEETYERLEADKKKQVHKKRKCPGPIITYHSVTVPLVGELGPKEENVDVEG
jgi:vacuolar protein sorting-associated protein 72